MKPPDFRWNKFIKCQPHLKFCLTKDDVEGIDLILRLLHLGASLLVIGNDVTNGKLANSLKFDGDLEQNLWNVYGIANLDLILITTKIFEKRLGYS